MPAQVVSREEMSIATEADIDAVRIEVRARAERRGFDAFATAAVATAASELSRNTWLHGGGGDAVIEELVDGARAGLRLEFRDEGPGIEDVARVLRGGFSTSGSLGLGLTGTRRLVDDFTIDSAPGKGTVVMVTKWARAW